MKEYIELYKEKNDKYYTVTRPNPSLWHLHYFFENDYRSYDVDVFNRVINSYNITFIYNYFENNMMYVGFSEWSLSDGEMHCPDEEEFPKYVNETNSCKISVDNFKEFTKKWIEIKKALPPFAIIYRDENDWVHCKGFDSKEDMELFVKNYQPEKVH